MARTGVKTNADVGVEIARLNDEQLLKLHAAVSREAARRHLTLSVGELGERLVIELFRTSEPPRVSWRLLGLSQAACRA